MSNRIKIGAIAVAIIVVATAIFLSSSLFSSISVYSPKPEALSGSYTLTADTGDIYGIDPDTSFTFKSSVKMSGDEVKHALNFHPAAEYGVKVAGDKEFVLKPKFALERNKVFKVAYTNINRNWAFQVRDNLKVLGALPRNQATGVPLDTGIEINFNFPEVKDFDKYFSISPSVEGRFEKHKNALVFVPKMLKPTVVYTVIIYGGVGLSTSKDKLGEDYRFQFETTGQGKEENEVTLNFQRDFYEYGVKETPVMGLYTYNLNEKKIKVDIYSFPTVDKFVRAINEKNSFPFWTRYGQHYFDTKKLNKVARFAVPIQKANEWTEYIRLPESLSEGYYLIEASVKGKRAQLFLQSTNVALCGVNSRTKILIWANDCGSKQPIDQAVINIPGTGFSVKTDRSGAAFFDPPKIVREKGAHLIVSAPGRKDVYLPLSSRGEGASVWDRYWYYVYTDRKLYQPSDKIKLWGIVRLREGKIPESEISVELWKNSWPQTSISKKKFKLSELGAFIGDFDFTKLQPGNYSLEFRLGDERLAEKYFEIQTYAKPAYKIMIEQDKKAIFVGEKARFKVTSQFFEGTPVASQDLSFSFSTDRYYYGRREGETFKTDLNGEKGLEYMGHNYNSDPDSAYLFVFPAKAEEAEIAGEAEVRVFNSHIKLLTEARAKDKIDGQVKIRAYEVDISRINKGTGKGWDDYLGKPVKGKTINLKLVEIYYEKEEAGDWYDFISKKVRKIYNYNRIEKEIESIKVQTDMNGECLYSFKMNPEKSYEVGLSAKDSIGRSSYETAYLWGDMNYFFENYSNAPALINKKKGERLKQYDEYMGDYSYWAPPSYLIGEKAEFDFVKNGQSLPVGGGNRYLFYNAQKGILSYSIQAFPAYSFSFEDKHIPNASVAGIYFDGKTYCLSEKDVRFNADAKKLEIQIKTDKKQYEPKDEVDLKVKVVDPKGNPIRAEVNLNLVDEAFYMLSPEKVDPLSDIYSGVSSGIIGTYLSHQYPEIQSGAEKGGGDGNEVRDNFRDMAYFGSVVTDSNGVASVKFQLPDNLTSWRVTAQAISPDMYAGHTVVNIPVSLPFFVETTYNNEFALQDRPIIKIRSFGKSLRPGRSVDYSVFAPTLGLEKSPRLAALAFQPLYYPLPALREGAHLIGVSGKAGEYKDTIVKPIQVIRSRFTKQINYYYKISKDLKIQGSTKARTALVLSDENRGRYLSQLYSLAWSWGDRVDQKLSRVIGKNLLKKYFNEKVYSDEDINVSGYQAPAGGIGLLPYSDAETPLSAKIAAVYPDLFYQTGLFSYLYTIVEDEKKGDDEKCPAMYGLACLGKADLVKLKLMLEHPTLSLPNRLYLALAAYKIGDEDLAKTIYQRIMRENARNKGRHTWLLYGKDMDDRLSVASLAAVLASSLNDPERDNLWNYVMDNHTKDILINLEKIMYITETMPRLPGTTAGFSVKTQKQKFDRIKLEKGGIFRVEIEPDEIKHLQFSDINGNVGLAVYYDEVVEPSQLKRDQNVRVNRKYYVDEVETNTFKEGDLVQVRLYTKILPNALGTSYQLIDILPSGLKVVTRSYARGMAYSTNQIYPYEINKQQLSFSVYKRKDEPDYYFYYAMVINKGKYVAEPAAIRSFVNPEILNLSDQDKIEIN